MDTKKLSELITSIIDKKEMVEEKSDKMDEMKGEMCDCECCKTRDNKCCMDNMK